MIPTLIPVVLSGGVGSRLWPLSREGQPKPFIKLFDGETLLEKTYRRISKLAYIPKVDGKPFTLTVTNREYYFMSKDELDKAGLSGVFLMEPEGRNTAPAISMAAYWIKAHYGHEASMLILPADHLIQDISQFVLSVNDAIKLNENTPPYLAAFGIIPKSPDTGFGYIETGEPLIKGFKAAHFYEKPDLETAKNYLASKRFYWNSGMFCFKVGQFLSEMKIYAPEVIKTTAAVWDLCVKNKTENDEKIVMSESLFKACPDISIDYALMEKSDQVAVIPADLGWSDIGSWLSLSELAKADHEGNSFVGEGLLLHSQNTFIHSNSRFIAAVGVQDLMIIDTSDALLVINKSNSQDVKLITEKLKKNQQEILKLHQTIKRPWGTFTTLQQGPLFKIKRIEVDPLKSLSLQSHKHRSEHWVVIEGVAEVFNQDRLYRIKTNESTFISEGAKHQLSNPSKDTKLIIIEVQSGSYVGEDDITRYKDDYGRI
jgi:mannose-1-phosphate guanylyltransferase/mannose-6-phosphate isomerase